MDPELLKSRTCEICKSYIGEPSRMRAHLQTKKHKALEIRVKELADSVRDLVREKVPENSTEIVTEILGRASDEMVNARVVEVNSTDNSNNTVTDNFFHKNSTVAITKVDTDGGSLPENVLENEVTENVPQNTVQNEVIKVTLVQPTTNEPSVTEKVQETVVTEPVTEKVQETVVTEPVTEIVQETVVEPEPVTKIVQETVVTEPVTEIVQETVVEPEPVTETVQEKVEHVESEDVIKPSDIINEVTETVQEKVINSADIINEVTEKVDEITSSDIVNEVTETVPENVVDHDFYVETPIDAEESIKIMTGGKRSIDLPEGYKSTDEVYEQVMKSVVSENTYTTIGGGDEEHKETPAEARAREKFMKVNGEHIRNFENSGYVLSNMQYVKSINDNSVVDGYLKASVTGFKLYNKAAEKGYIEDEDFATTLNHWNKARANLKLRSMQILTGTE